MSVMIPDLSSPDLLDALETNMAAFWMAYGQAPDTIMVADQEVSWVLMGVPEALFNGVFRARMSPERVAEKLSSLYAAQEHLRVPLLWWLGPLSEPRGLGDLLAEHGWVHAGTTPGMAMVLGDLPDGPLPAGVAIKRVHNADELRIWGQIAGEGNGFRPEVVATLVELEAYASGYPSEADRRSYIGYLDGEPVATSAMVLSDGVAGIYAVATLPAARRRGIGAALTRIPLLEAQAEGYRVGTLQSSEMGHACIQRYLAFGMFANFRCISARSKTHT